MRKIIIILGLLVFSIFSASCSPTINMSSDIQGSLKKFSSVDELKEFLKRGQDYDRGYYRTGTYLRNAVMEESFDSVGITAKMAEAGQAYDYSATNVQVEGVDEADIVKNDGRYIYVLTGDKIAIIDAYPAEDAELISEIEVDGNPREMFIKGDKLIVFGTDYRRSEKAVPLLEDNNDKENVSRNTKERIVDKINFPEYSYDFAYAVIYDISDKEEPKEEERLIMAGNYYDSRMIGDYVYMITNEYVWYRKEITPPCVYSIKGEVISKRCMPASDIYYFDYPDNYEFSTIMAINLNDNSHSEKTVLKGTTQNMYVSEENIFITYQKKLPWYEMQWKVLKEVVIPELPAEIKDRVKKIESYDISEQSRFTEVQIIIQEWLYDMDKDEREDMQKYIDKKSKEAMIRIQKELEVTYIQKISIDRKNIVPEKAGKVPGRVLNQFSMDEYEGYFRIATTNSQWDRERSVNHVYILDEDMETIGKLEDIAPGERIYSARFIGERLYLTTFRQIDPLFVIDLSDNENPSILGKLKIPGYSEYLHPYDKNHIIGIGKETEESKEGDFTRQKGVKLSLFDVTDVEKPKEIDNFEIGDRGTESYALNDHKAFLFSKEKNLLVIPVTVAEIDEDKYPDGIERWQYGDYVFQGAYVFNLSVEDGFRLKGKITHIEDEEKFQKSGYYWYSSEENIKRSLYIDNVLYTISDSKVKMNSLDTLKEMNEIDLPYERPAYMDYRIIPIADEILI